MPKVSVIILTYNRAKLLSSAIQSVLKQTFQDFEIIVVDDASKDNTKEVLTSFNDNRIKYIRHEINKGEAGARNTGVRNSNAEYIAFLDDDDEWLPEKLKMQIDLLESSSPEVGGVYTGILQIDRTSGKILSQVIPTKKGNIFSEMFAYNWVGTPSTVLLRRECFNRVGLFDEGLPNYPDYDMWIRISKIFEFEFIQEPLVKYYIHENRLTTNSLKSIRAIEMLFKKYDQFKLNKKGYSYYSYILGVLYCSSGNTKKGREALLKAIKLCPFEIRNYFYLSLSLFGVSGFKKLKEIKEKIVAP